MTQTQQTITEALRAIASNVREAQAGGVPLLACRECSIIWEASQAYEGHRKTCSVGIARAALHALESASPVEPACECARLRRAIKEYRRWFDTCTHTSAVKWEEQAADAIDELDAALASPVEPVSLVVRLCGPLCPCCGKPRTNCDCEAHTFAPNYQQGDNHAAVEAQKRTTPTGATEGRATGEAAGGNAEPSVEAKEGGVVAPAEDAKPPACPKEEQIVFVAGGVAQYRGGTYYTGMEDPRYERPIQWPVTWWLPLTWTPGAKPPACDCPARTAISELLKCPDGRSLTWPEIDEICRAALAAPCPTADLRDEIEQHNLWRAEAYRQLAEKDAEIERQKIEAIGSTRRYQRRHAEVFERAERAIAESAVLKASLAPLKHAEYERGKRERTQEIFVAVRGFLPSDAEQRFRAAFGLDETTGEAVSR